MELLLAFIGTAILYTFVRTRLTQVRRNIEREELLRDLIKTAERKKRIDALYGRNEKTR
jgi:23S rRNA maturation mini-RNase III